MSQVRGSRLPHIVLALVVGAIYLGGGLEFLEGPLMDLRFRLLGRPASGQVVVAAIDPRSLEALEVWPWPRGYHATVLENLLDAGARRVAFDLDFSSRSIAEEDESFAGALAASRGRAILPVFRQWQLDGGAGGGLVATEPLPILSSHASLATINIQPESGGLVRRYGARELAPSIPSMAGALAGAVGPEPSAFYLDYGIDADAIPRISYVDVLTRQFDPGQVAGKVVIVGATAVELGDQVAVPVRATMAGPVLQALAFECITAGRALGRVPPAAGFVLTLLCGWFLGHRVQRVSWRRGFVILALAGACLVIVSAAVQRFSPLLLDTSPVALTLACSYAVGLARRIDQQDLRLIVQAMKVRSSEARMRQVVQNSFDAIVTLDLRGRIESFNPAAERMFGYRAEDLLGRSIEPLVAGALEDPPAAGSDDGGPPGLLREAIGRRRDGGRFPVELTLSAYEAEGRAQRVAFLRDITLRKAQEEALEHQATHDALTDLPNRLMLQRRIGEALSAAGRQPAPVAFLILDLDRFKEINDTLGHHVGDVLLHQIACRLKAPLRPDDTIARLGGDEFAVLLPSAGAGQARAMAEKLIEALKEPFELHGLTLRVETSIGIAIYPDHGSDATTLIQRGDVAMYVAKRLRNSVALYSPEQDLNSVRHLTLKGELQRAVDGSLLELHYQPKISSRTGRVEGVEALLRWPHPEHGLVPPAEFIPLAEQTGLMRTITGWVLDTALRQCAAWERMGYRVPVSVNCSARNLLEEDLPEEVERRLRVLGLTADRLILEITETAIIEDPQRALEVVTALARRGIRISIDDFGTGYSSLDYLRKLPARELKIDRSFIVGMQDGKGDAVIVRSTIDLAHNLGLQAAAEGVDSEAGWATLRALGCDLAQGYLFARPAPAEEITRWIATSAWGLPSILQARAD